MCRNVIGASYAVKEARDERAGPDAARVGLGYFPGRSARSQAGLETQAATALVRLEGKDSDSLRVLSHQVREVAREPALAAGGDERGTKSSVHLSGGSHYRSLRSAAFRLRRVRSNPSSSWAVCGVSRWM